MADKILVVDDDREVLHYITNFLSREGFQVIGLTNAEEAIRLTEKEKPDLIISDVKMPVMDGVELCWMIRQNSSIPMVPFIFLTGYDDEDLQVNGYRAGADDYLLKPIKPSILLNIVRSLISRYKKLLNVGGRKSIGISGKTSEISQVEILQLLSATRKTGTFTIVEDNIEGSIYLRNGNIIDARLGNMDGIEAANLIITNMEGEYYFTPGPINLDEKIRISTLNLLMEACRRFDEKGKNIRR